MRDFVGGAQFAELQVDPFDARAVRDQIIDYARRLSKNARFGINLTGGTKMMFAGALYAARAIGAIPFYFEDRKVTFLDTFSRAPIKSIDSIETFLKINSNGLQISDDNRLKPSLTTDRRSLTDKLWSWSGRKDFNKLYEKLKKYLDNTRPFDFPIEYNGFVFNLTNAGQATAKGHGLDLTFDDWNFAKYLSGGWFEEYVYLQCEPHERSGVIKDLRINVELTMESGGKQQNKISDNIYNELDVVFTDGYSLHIVECKTGAVKQDQVSKLKNLVRFCGGVRGQGIFASCLQTKSKVVQKKISDAGLTHWYGNSIIRAC